MKKIAALLSIVGLLGAAGCGGSICSRTRDVFKDKLGTCSTYSDTQVTDAELKTCEQNVSKCTNDDQTKINKYLDCVKALPACASGAEASFAVSFGACATANVTGVSDACLTALAGR